MFCWWCFVCGSMLVHSVKTDGSWFMKFIRIKTKRVVQVRHVYTLRVAQSHQVVHPLCQPVLLLLYTIIFLSEPSSSQSLSSLHPHWVNQRWRPLKCFCRVYSVICLNTPTVRTHAQHTSASICYDQTGWFSPGATVREVIITQCKVDLKWQLLQWVPNILGSIRA